MNSSISENAWTEQEKKYLSATIALMLAQPREYQVKYNLKQVLVWWRLKLEQSYTVEEVVAAIDYFTDQPENANKIIQPADVIGILNQAERRVTHAEYIHALDWQKDNGKSEFTDAAQTIARFKSQNQPIEKDQILKRSDLFRLVERYKATEQKTTEIENQKPIMIG